MSRTSYYQILNVRPDSSDEEIKRAYRLLAKKHHPDMHPQNRQLAALRFKLLNEAYAGLKTREQRLHYNQFLNMDAKNDNRPDSFLSWIAKIFSHPAKNTNGLRTS